MRHRRRHLALLLFCLLPAAAPARALALPGDPIVIADDTLAPEGIFDHAVDRVSLANGSPTQLTPERALPSASALAFTGADTLVTVGSDTLARLNLTSGELDAVSAPGAGELKGVAVAPDGSVYATDGGPSGGTAADGRVVRLDTSTGAVTAVSSEGLLVNPLGIAVAEDGSIYVTNSDGNGQGQVVKVDPSNGAQSDVAPPAPAPNLLRTPWGIDFLPNGDLVVADANYNGAFRGALVRIDPNSGEQTARLLENLEVEIDNATGVAVDDSGEVILTERSSAQLDRVNLQTGSASQIGSDVPSPLDVEAEPGVPPTTTILSGPSQKTPDTTPTFTFQPSQYGSTSSCEIDGGAAAPCQRTFTAPELAPGAHSFSVHSTHFGFDGPEATRSFTVDPDLRDTQIDSGPTGLTNDPTPTFTFEAPGGGTSFTCAFDDETPTACETPFTPATPLPDGAHTFTVRADNDPIGDSRSFTVDTTPPDTSITSGPAENASTSATKPTFTFDSTELGSTFECELDGAPVACGSTFTPEADLVEGAHTLSVQALDEAENADPTPVIRHFTVDLTAPTATITGGPSGTTQEAAPTFTFTASEGGAFFRCSIDDPTTLTACPSPFTVSPALADGAHTFRVRAVDAAGNQGPIAERSFSVETDTPETSITAGPSGLTNQSEAVFEFQSTKPNSTFECTLDASSAPCESPFEATLADGQHTFGVIATDELGHADPSAATRTFTVDTTPPVTTFDAGPGPLTNDSTPEFRFSSEPGATFTCQLDVQAPTACTSPLTAPTLADGPHNFRVTATDEAGNAETAPPHLLFSVDTIPPQVQIDGGPDGDTADRRPTFSFSGDADAVFGCRIDGGGLVNCEGTFQPPAPLADGPHVFEVLASDQAGNPNPTPAVRNFRVIPEGTKKEPPTEPPPKPQPPREHQRISPQLGLTGGLHGRVLKLRISAAPTATGSVAVRVTARLGGKQVRRRLNLALQAGAITGTLRLPAGLSKVKVTAGYGGDDDYLPASAVQTVRARSR
jgi:streptogramin lyase